MIKKMLITLLLVILSSAVAAEEWFEIAQDRYVNFDRIKTNAA